MQDFQKVIAWRRSHALMLEIVRVFRGRRSPIPGHIAQLLRSCARVPAAIAEGCLRRTPADKSRFVDIAVASAGETLNHLIAARDLAVVTQSESEMLEREAHEVTRIAAGFARAVRRGNGLDDQRHPT